MEQTIPPDNPEQELTDRQYRLFVENANVGFWSITHDHTITYVNPRMAAMLGYEPAEILGRKVEDYIFPDDLPDHKAYISQRRAGRTGQFERRLRKKDGAAMYTQVSTTPVFDARGSFCGAFAVITDITRQKREESILAARLLLAQYSLDHTLAEVLTYTLDLIGELTGSPLGFCHFLDADQQTLTLQSWSTTASPGLEPAGRQGKHSDIHQAGVWADCVRERRPVIHNDYASLSHRKGLPVGHAEIIRDLAAPVFRGERIMAVLAVANKAQDYTADDLRLIERFADLAWDIAERKIAEEKLRESETRFRRFAENARDIIFRFEVTPEMRISYVNPAAQTLLGYTPEELYADPDLLLRITDPEVLPPTGPLSGEHIAAHPVTVRLVGKDGQSAWFEASAAPVYGPDGRVIATEGIARDVTERVRAEEALRQSENELNLAQTIAHVGSYTWNLVEKTARWSAEMRRIVGAGPDEELSLARVLAQVHPDDHARVTQTIGEHQASGLPLDLEFRIQRPDGALRHILARDQVRYDAHNQPVAVYGILQDITARKETEEALRASEESYRQLFESESDALLLIDTHTGRIVQANTAALTMYGYEREELLSLRAVDISAEPEETRKLTHPRTPPEADTVLHIPLRIHRRKDGRQMPVEITGRYFYMHGEPVHIAAIRDISAHVQAEEQLRRNEEQLRASLEEKEVLLRELYHRTKNNMQVISAMLGLQRHAAADARTQEILADMENRIMSMSLVHQKLYQSGSLSRMDLGEYLRELLHLLQGSHQRGQPVAVTTNLESLSVQIDTAVPCGLIVNELISNAFKHAFHSGAAAPEIHVDLRRTPAGGIHLTVRDNGGGLPAGYDPREDGRLGVRTLLALVEYQLQGSLVFDSSPQGLTVEIEFTENQARERV